MLKDIRSKLNERFGLDKRPKFVMASPTECAAEVATKDDILLLLFAGVGDSNCHLSLLRGMPHILKLIFQLATNEYWWKRCIRLPDSEKDAQIVRIYKNRDWNRWHKLREPKGNYLFFTELRASRYDSR